MKTILILLTFITCSLYSAEIKNILTPKSIYYFGDKINFNFKVESNTEPTQFILSEVKGLDSKNIKLIDSKISCNTLVKENKTVISYAFEFVFIAHTIGTIDIEPINLTFIDASGTKQTLHTQKFSVKVEKKYKKYIKLIIIVALVLFIGFLIIFIKKKIKIKNTQKLLSLQKIEFKKLKIQSEQSALDQIKSITSYAISGEYDKYCNKIIEILSEYFKLCYPDKKIINTIQSIKENKINNLSENINKKFEQLFALIEEFIYTGKIPMQSDLDRILTLTKEIIAEHRENI